MKQSKGKSKSFSKDEKFQPGKRKGSSKATGTKSITDQHSRSYGGNDFAWYNRNPDLLNSAAQIPFAWQPGRNIPNVVTTFDHPDYKEENLPQQLTYNYPGICRLNFSPTVGYSADKLSPINIAAMEIYGKIRKSYSGSLAVDAPDLMMYILALDSIYIAIEDFKRAYYTAHAFTARNLNMPEGIVKAMGWDFDDILINKTLMRQYIVELTAMVRRFKLPDIMDLYKRHSFLAQNIYADSPSTKAQFYVFVPQHLMMLQNTDTQTKLVAFDWHTNNSLSTDGYLSVSNAYVQIRSMIQLLQNWDDAYTINGYFERAFDGVPSYTCADLSTDAILAPVYNPEVLLQIQNVNPMPVVSSSLDITYSPTDNVIIQKPVLLGNFTGKTGMRGIPTEGHFITIPGDTQPAVNDITIATRLTSIIHSMEGDNALFYIDCGTEVVSNVLYYSWNKVSNVLTLINREGTLNMGAYIELKGQAPATVLNCLAPIAFSSAFTAHPTFSVLGYVTDHWEFYTNMATDNVSVIHHDELENLHRICTYSEFNCFAGI